MTTRSSVHGFDAPADSPTSPPESLESEALAREARLVSWLRDQGSVAIGFSGGVDSSYLACVALDALGAENVLAVIGRSATYPVVQWERARAVADRFAVPVLEVDTDELHDPRYAANPTNRCYFCKSELWNRVLPVARAQGMNVVVDGTNADDVHGHRPGRRAADEQGVRSPLAELGFSKADIRLLSRLRDIPTWSQPASPCLASRLPYGTAVTTVRLARVEQAEAALRALGISGDLRVRDHGDVGRVELGQAELADWLRPARVAALTDAVRGAGFPRAAVDLGGFRSGSLNSLGSPDSIGDAMKENAESAVAPRGGAPDVGTRDAPTDRADVAAALLPSLAPLGLECRVEATGSLAVVTVDDAASSSTDVTTLADRGLCDDVLDAARKLGFTHVALEWRGENG